uniref:Uncharacterized protein n=1 Tax=Panagrolaimus superbus TaxID=310955 RepID=A0A914Y828_9BILA
MGDWVTNRTEWADTNLGTEYRKGVGTFLNYPACKTVTTGSGETLNSYTTCCCKTNLCNSGTFQGETPESLAKANLEAVDETNFDESLNNAIRR